MMAIERDCGRCLRSSAAAHGVSLGATVVVRLRPWASALFAGVRLTVAVTGDDDGKLDEWLIALPEHDLPLDGYFVADVTIVSRDRGAATIELLLIED